MRSLVGIFQKKEQVDHCLDSLGVGHNDIVEVGPFASQLQAVEWMDFIGEKIKNYELALRPAAHRNKKPWYGFTAVR